MKTAIKAKILMIGLLICLLLVSCKSESSIETTGDREHITEQTTILEDETRTAEASASSKETNSSAEAKMVFLCDITAMQDREVPEVSLTVEPLALIPQNSDYQWIGDQYAASAAIGEVGHEPVSLTEEEARAYAADWIRDHCTEYPEDMIRTEDMEVAPITMEDGNTEGQIVAYSVFKAHDYNGVSVLGDHYNMIVDDGGEIYISLQWSECKEVATCTSDPSMDPINFEKAKQLVRQYLSKPGGYQNPNDEQLQDIRIDQVELVYSFNENSGLYQPNWRFRVAGYRYVLVNCMDGRITEM